MKKIVSAILALVAAAAASSPPLSGYACLFEGVNNHVTTSWALSQTLTEVTAAWWFRTDTPFVTSYPILTYLNDTSHILSFGAEHVPWMYVYDDDASSIYGTDGSFSENVGQWYHVAFTWSNSDGLIHFYQDGVSIGSGQIYKGTTFPAGGHFVFPNFMWGGDHAFGPVDELGFWTTKLSAAQVTALAAGQLPTAYPTGLVMHWSCDDYNMTAVADDVSGKPALISSDWVGHDLKVPSTAPSVNVNWTVFPVIASAGSKTKLGLPASTTIQTLPSVGSLVTASGAAVAAMSSPAEVYFVAPAGGLVEPTTFATSYAAKVTLVPNAAPVPVAFANTVMDYSSASFDSVWKCDVGSKPSQADVYVIDTNGDNLLGWITALPQLGSLKQLTGEEIRSVPAQITDPWLRITYVSGAGTVGRNDTFSLMFGDGLENSSSVEHTMVITRTKLPPVIEAASVTADSGHAVSLSLNVTYDPSSLATFFAAVPHHGSLLSSDGKALPVNATSLTLYQWASSVAAYSSQWDNASAAARNVIGYPETFPRYSARVHDWAANNSIEGTEWIHVVYELPVVVTGVTVYEVQCSNSVTGIMQRAENGVDWEVLYARTPRTTPCSTTSLAFSPQIDVSHSHVTRELFVNVSHLDNEWPNVEGIRLTGKLAASVVRVPSSRTLLYKRNGGSTATADSFSVFSANDAIVLAQIPYTYYTSHVTVNVTITGSSGASALVATSLSLLAFLASSLL